MEAELNPNYDEVVSVLRQQLEDARFQLTVAQLTLSKLRDYAATLEKAAGLEEEEDESASS